MRDILFRAKLKDDYFNKGWQYGLVYCTWFSGSIFKYWLTPIKKENLTTSDTVCVDSDTICQYTGLNDKNGTKIFEGDIVKTEQIIPVLGTNIFAVEYAHGNYFIRHNSTVLSLFSVNESAEVVGNIYDSPELIEG